MNELGKPFTKNPIEKMKENSKYQVEIAACEQKTTSEKANFCFNAIFSLYFKIRAKKTTSFFGVTKITTQIRFKNHENV